MTKETEQLMQEYGGLIAALGDKCVEIELTKAHLAKLQIAYQEVFNQANAARIKYQDSMRKSKIEVIQGGIQ